MHTLNMTYTCGLLDKSFPQLRQSTSLDLYTVQCARNFWKHLSENITINEFEGLWNIYETWSLIEGYSSEGFCMGSGTKPDSYPVLYWGDIHTSARRREERWDKAIKMMGKMLRVAGGLWHWHPRSKDRSVFLCKHQKIQNPHQQAFHEGTRP